MKNNFVANVLSSRKQRQRFFWARNIISIGCAFWVLSLVGQNDFGVFAAGFSLVAAYFTIAPIVAFLVCLLEQMFS